MESDQQEREDMIKKISEAAKLSKIDSASWAFLWFSDIDKLARLLHIANTFPSAAFMLLAPGQNELTLKDWLVKTQSSELGKRKANLIEYETARPTKVARTETSSNAQVKRSDSARKACSVRDKDMCCTYGEKEPQEKLHIASDLKSSHMNCKLIDCVTEKLIHSGHVVTFTTCDPESMPLPSSDILEMQWYLNRVAALSGAADIPEESSEDEDDAEEEEGEMLVNLGSDLDSIVLVGRDLDGQQAKSARPPRP